MTLLDRERFIKYKAKRLRHFMALVTHHTTEIEKLQSELVKRRQSLAKLIFELESEHAHIANDIFNEASTDPQTVKNLLS